jgi:hypothetical protein
MYVEDVYRRFVSYVQEPDESWLTPSDITDMMLDAYTNVRQFVTNYYEQAYAETLEGVAPADGEIDLSDPTNPFGQALLGTNAIATGALQKIYAIEKVATGPGQARTDHVLDAVHNMDELTQHTFAYLFRPPLVLLGGNNTGNIRLVFEREPTQVWSNSAAGDSEYIDDYPITHQLIVYYAIEKYGLRDGDRMQVLYENLKREEDKVLTWARRNWPRGRRVTRVRRFL